MAIDWRGRWALILLLSASPVAAQRLGQAADTGVSIGRVMAALLFCILLAGLGAYLLQRRGGQLPRWLAASLVMRGHASRDVRLTIRDTLRISPQITILIVACDGKELLLSAAGPHLTVLATLPLAETATVPLAPPMTPGR